MPANSRRRPLHLARQVRVVERIRVDERFVGDEFQIGAAEGMAAASSEVAEGHTVVAVFPRFELMHRAGEPKGGSQLATASGSRKAR